MATREAVIAKLEQCQTEDLKVSSSAPASHRAPVGAAPDFQRVHCLCNLSGCGVNFVLGDFTVLVFLDCIAYAGKWHDAETVDRLQEELAPLRECLVASSVLESGHLAALLHRCCFDSVLRRCSCVWACCS